MRTRASAPLVAVLLLALALAQGSMLHAEEAPWPMLRGDAGARGSLELSTDDTLPMPEWHFSRLTKRKYRPGVPVWASPALATVDGRPMAFVGGYDSTMHALDLADKSERWSKVTNGPIMTAAAVGKVLGREVVYWGSSDRTVYAHFADDGSRLWSRELVAPTRSQGDAMLSSPCLHGDMLFINAFVYDKALATNEQKGTLFALEAATGRIVWRAVISRGPLSSPVLAQLPTGPRIFAAARKGLLTAVDFTSDGPQVAWTYQMPHEVLGSPALLTSGGRTTVFLGSKFGNVIALDSRNGEVLWKTMAGNWVDNTCSAVELDGRGVVFCGSHDYTLYALDANTGEVIWRKHLGGEVYSAPAFFTDGREPLVAVSCLDNHSYVLRARDGSVLTSYFTGSPLWDKISKGDVLWGSPSAFEAGPNTALVLGSYSGMILTLPLEGECTLRVTARTASSLWLWLVITAGVFLLVVVPVAVRGD